MNLTITPASRSPSNTMTFFNGMPMVPRTTEFKVSKATRWRGIHTVSLPVGLRGKLQVAVNKSSFKTHRRVHAGWDDHTNDFICFNETSKRHKQRVILTDNVHCEQGKVPESVSTGEVELEASTQMSRTPQATMPWHTRKWTQRKNPTRKTSRGQSSRSATKKTSRSSKSSTPPSRQRTGRRPKSFLHLHCSKIV